MSDVTRILSRIEQGESTAADQLLPLVYEDLRKLAAAKLAGERPGQTLQATALVHDHCDIAVPEISDDVLAVDEALTKLAAMDAQLAELVKLRCFAGLTIPEVAEALSVAPRTADRRWAYARSWLFEEIRGR